jgi:hypothetical protein
MCIIHISVIIRDLCTSSATGHYAAPQSFPPSAPLAIMPAAPWWLRSATGRAKLSVGRGGVGEFRR